jgi:hypothetical protein
VLSIPDPQVLVAMKVEARRREYAQSTPWRKKLIADELALDMLEEAEAYGGVFYPASFFRRMPPGIL